MLHVTQFGYDALGEKTSQQDANGHITTFSYDIRGRLLSKTLPGGQSDGRTYDGLGRLLTMTDFNGKMTTFAYDPLSGRLLSKTASVGGTATGESVSFTYNLLDGSRKTATRTPATGTGASVTTTYAYYGYDANSNPIPDFRQGQLQSVTTQASGGPARIISYSYDLLGNKTSMTTPGGKTIGYGYDVLNRLSTVTHPDNAVTTFQYDKVGNRQSVSRSTSATASPFSTTIYGYDSLNRLTDIVNQTGGGALVSSYHYGLRADGKRSSVTESGPSTSKATTNYTYDDSGKLIEEAGSYADIKYGYDNVGNRLTRTVTGAATGNGTTLVNGTTNTTYDQNDRIVGHSYDADGNETTVNGQTASYDFENHLVSLASTANNTVLASYTYDADGNRCSTYMSSNNPTTTSYVVDTSLPYASVVEEYSGTATAPSARYDYGDDLVRMDRSGVYYYLYDGLGSTRQLVSTAGAVTDTWGYSAFGEMASHTGSTVNPFLFNAQQFDQASGDYYLRARYYDQGNGRFISQDPYSGSDQTPISLHRYVYAGCDPVNFVDPSGAAPNDSARGQFLEANIYGQYISDYPSTGTQSNNSKQYYNANGWIPISVYYASGQNKNQNNKEPDIFDFTPGVFTFNEVKPFSLLNVTFKSGGGIFRGGIPDGIDQILEYWRAYSPSNPNAPSGFRPETHWTPKNQPIYYPGDGKRYSVFNLGGILFYVSDEYKRAAARLTPVLPLLIDCESPEAAEAGFEEIAPELLEAGQQLQVTATAQTAEAMIINAYQADVAEEETEDAEATLVAL